MEEGRKKGRKEEKKERRKDKDNIHHAVGKTSLFRAMSGSEKAVKLDQKGDTVSTGFAFLFLFFFSFFPFIPFFSLIFRGNRHFGSPDRGYEFFNLGFWRSRGAFFPPFSATQQINSYKHVLCVCVG